MKTLSFSHIKFAELQKVVNIRQIANDDLFAEWFAYNDTISKDPRTRDPERARRFSVHEKRIQNRQRLFNHVSVLQIFGIQRGTSGFMRSRDHQTIPV